MAADFTKIDLSQRQLLGQLKVIRALDKGNDPYLSDAIQLLETVINLVEKGLPIEEEVYRSVDHQVHLLIDAYQRPGVFEAIMKLADEAEARGEGYYHVKELINYTLREMETNHPKTFKKEVLEKLLTRETVTGADRSHVDLFFAHLIEKDVKTAKLKNNS